MVKNIRPILIKIVSKYKMCDYKTLMKSTIEELFKIINKYYAIKKIQKFFMAYNKKKKELFYKSTNEELLIMKQENESFKNQIKSYNEIIKENFILNKKIQDLEYKIKNMKNNFKKKHSKNSSSNTSSSNNSGIDDKHIKSVINYHKILDISENKLNNILIEEFNYSIKDLKSISYHEKKQMLNRKQNDKYQRLFNNN